MGYTEISLCHISGADFIITAALFFLNEACCVLFNIDLIKILRKMCSLKYGIYPIQLYCHQ